jgi:L-amino acid N-acyltransferase YncA
VNIRPATAADDEAIWRILEPTFRAGETYPIPRDISRTDALAYWRSKDHTVFVAEDDGAIAGTYYLRANNRGGGAHVANCGYIVAPDAMGRGVARSMCDHSIREATVRGFRAIQFNFSCGFAIVGWLPDAFEHPRLGMVDAYVMVRSL